MNQLCTTFLFAEKPSQAKAYAEAFGVRNKAPEGHYYYIPPNSTFPKAAIVFWAFGHLLQPQEIHLYSGKEKYKNWNITDLPIQYPEETVYVPSDAGKEKHLNAMKNTIQDMIRQHGASSITGIDSCDCDAEGSGIFWNFIRYCVTPEQENQMTIKRLWINSLDSSVILNGLQPDNLLSKEQDLLNYEYSRIRSLSDLRVGTSLTRLYTLLLKGLIQLLAQQVIERRGGTVSTNLIHDILGSKSFRTGRVISVLAHFVYKRTLEIENFEPQTFYELIGKFEVHNGTYEGKAKLKTFDKIEVNKLLQQHQIHLDKPMNGLVKELQKEERRTKAPVLYSLTSLQKKANNKWKMSPITVLNICQSLYEKFKLTTYPRTDCELLTTKEFNYLLENVEKYKASIGATFVNAYTEPRSKFVNNSEVLEHHALTVTRRVLTPQILGTMSENEKKIYFEILRSTLAMFADDYIYEQTTVITDVNGLEFKTVGKSEVSRGFKELWSEEEDEAAAKKTTKKEPDQQIPLLSINLHSNSLISIKNGRTSSPAAYTPATILEAMQNCGKEVTDLEESAALKAAEGIGTGATRANAIESIIEAGYVILEKNKFVLTTKGLIYCVATDGTLLSEPTMTAKWEIYLKGIQEGRNPSQKFLDTIDAFIVKTVSEAPVRMTYDAKVTYFSKLIEQHLENSILGPCPKCKGDVKLVMNKFYGCSNFNHSLEPCSFSLPLAISGKKLTATQLKALLTKGQTTYMKFTPKDKEKKPYEALIKLKGDFTGVILEFKERAAKKPQ